MIESSENNEMLITPFRRWFRGIPLPLRLFTLIVIFPTIIASIYYGLIASDVFVSEAKYAVRMNSDNFSPDFLNSVASIGGNDSANEDTLIIKEYILSRDMLRELDSKLPLRKHYSSDGVDFFSRMDGDASIEDYLEYYRQMIRIEIDQSANIITIKTRAFNPTIAQKTANTVIALSEKLVNELSDRVVNDSLRFARKEFENAEALIRNANAAMTRFRSDSHSIDPDQETSAVLGIVTGLETELATARTALIETSSFMRADSSQIKLLKGKVEALEKQVKEERKRLASGEGTELDYTKLIDNYAPLALEQELSKIRYTSALASLELARIEAQNKQRYLISFVKPNLPDVSTEPERFHSILVIFFGLCIIYAISGLVWAAIKDHMRI